MNNLWTKIGLGALGVFVVGMVVVGVANDARTSLTDALRSSFEPETATAATDPAASSASETSRPVAQLAGIRKLAARLQGVAPVVGQHDMAFRLDGRRIGTIRRLVIQRNIRDEIPAMNLIVDLTSRAEADRLTGCDLLLADGQGSGVEEGFSCADEDSKGLVTVGWARFEPVGESRPVAVSQSASRQMRDGDPFKATIEPDGQVQVEATGHDGKLVQLRADNGGATIRVNDALGRAIFGLLADSTGARLRVRGKDGRDIVRMEASQAGFTLTIDTSAAH